jgi:hypothetical protein
VPGISSRRGEGNHAESQSVRIADVPAGILTEYLWDTSVRRYFETRRFGGATDAPKVARMTLRDCDRTASFSRVCTDLWDSL